MRTIAPLLALALAPSLATVVLPSCRDESLPKGERDAVLLFRQVLEHPDPVLLESFERANGLSGVGQSPHDQAGIERQLRWSEATARVTAAQSDPVLAQSIVDQVARLRDKGLLDEYEGTLPGSRRRFENAEAKALEQLPHLPRPKR